MKEFLDRLREKPESQRQMIAGVFVLVVMAFIFTGWASIKLSQIAEISNPEKQLEQNASAPKADITSLLTMLKKQAREIFSEGRAILEDVGTAIDGRGLEYKSDTIIVPLPIGTSAGTSTTSTTTGRVAEESPLATTTKKTAE